MRLIGSIIISFLCGALGISIYNFELHTFSFVNLLAVTVLVVIWLFMCELIDIMRSK